MKEKIIDLYKSGLSYNQIVKLLGCSKATVSYHCTTISRYGIKVTEELITKMKELYKNGISCPIIAKELNLSASTVNNYLRKDKEAPIKDPNRSKKRVRLYNRKIKQLCIDYKGGSCSICGYDKCIISLDFHHLDPSIKDFNISGGTRSFEKLKPELDKCILVCRNCHGEIHEKIFNEE